MAKAADNSRTSKKRVFINSISAVFTRVFRAFVLLWVYKRLLGTISDEEFSIYPPIAAIITFLPIFTDILTAGLGRYIVEAEAKGDHGYIEQIVSTMLIPLSVMSVVLVLGGGVFSWYVGDILGIDARYVFDARVMMWLLFVLGAVNLAANPFALGLYVRQRFVTFNVIDIFVEILRIAILLVLLFGVSNRVLWVVISTFVADLSGIFIKVFLSRGLVEGLRFRISSIRWRILPNLVFFGGWMMVSRLANVIRSKADPIILKVMSSPLAVNSFFIGSIPLVQLSMLSLRMTRPIQPVLIAMYANEDWKRIRNTYLRFGRYGLWASMFFVVPLCYFRHEVINLYVGSEYEAASTVMLLLLMLFPIQYGNILMPKIAVATGNISRMTINECLIQLSNLGLTFYFVGKLKMGALGSASATFIVLIIGYPLLQIPLGLKLARVSFISWLRRTVLPGFMPSVFAFGVCYYMGMVLEPDSWFELGYCAISACLMYAGVTLTFALCEDDKRDIDNLLRKLGGQRFCRN